MVLLFGDAVRVDIETDIIPVVGQRTRYNDNKGAPIHGQIRVIFDGDPLVVACNVLPDPNLASEIAFRFSPKARERLAALRGEKRK